MGRRKRADTSLTLLELTDTKKLAINRLVELVSIRDWYLEGDDQVTLAQYKRSQLSDMCTARGIDDPNISTKSEFVSALLRWRKHALPPGTPATNITKTFGSMPDLQQQARLLSGSRDSHLSSIDETNAIFTLPRISALSIINDEINYADLKFGKKVGSGGYKDVFVGSYKGAEVAIGIISALKLTDDDLTDIDKEMSLLQELRHDNIVRFVGISKDYQPHLDRPFSNVSVITEFCPYGDLSDYMQSRERPSFQKQLGLMYGIAFGVSYLHARRPAIIHRDLKSLNILIDADEKAKITDFGLAKVRSKARAMMHSVVGTINWQAPEMWCENATYTEKVDVYSCGLIFWEVLMWSNKYPYIEMKDFQIYERVGKEGYRPPLHNHGDFKKYPRSMLDLIEIMWHASPDERPDMNQVLAALSEMIK